LREPGVSVKVVFRNDVEFRDLFDFRRGQSGNAGCPVRGAGGEMPLKLVRHVGVFAQIFAIRVTVTKHDVQRPKAGLIII
jgi:hypothetical protein